ncbi:MAG: hypothetical protein KDE48_15970 [Anaerolineales bacterium]|nr:hypothetical protein [Anaerolineales bacterium]
MDSIVTLHGALKNTVWLFYLIIGLWGLFRAIRGQGVNGSYLGALVVAQIVIVVQVILGAVLFIGGQSGALSRPYMHYLYAAFGLVFLPFVFLYWLRGDDTNRAQWVLSFATLFLFGTMVRFGAAF